VKLLLVALLFFPASLFAQGQEWTRLDKSLLITYQVARFIDWRQTLSIAEERRPDGSFRWREINPLLGDHPSAGRVNSHYVITALAVPLIAHYLPPSYRRAFLTGAVVVEVGYVAHNFNLGISMRW